MGALKRAVQAIKDWIAEKQPDWYIKAVRKTIADLPGGYEEAPSWLGSKVTVDSIFNRLRTNGDQVFPLGWAMVLQKASGEHHIAHAIARASGGVFNPLPDMDDVDNEDINQRLIEVFEQIARYSQQVKSAIDDGVIDTRERSVINDELYLAIAKLQEHSALLYRVFCISEKVDAPDMQSEASGATKSVCGEITA